jgi:hypothetical protein
MQGNRKVEVARPPSGVGLGQRPRSKTQLGAAVPHQVAIS